MRAVRRNIPPARLYLSWFRRAALPSAMPGNTHSGRGRAVLLHASHRGDIAPCGSNSACLASWTPLRQPLSYNTLPTYSILEEGKQAAERGEYCTRLRRIPVATYFYSS